MSSTSNPASPTPESTSPSSPNNDPSSLSASIGSRRALITAVLSFVAITAAVIIGTTIYQRTLTENLRTQVVNNLEQHANTLKLSFASRASLVNEFASVLGTHTIGELDREFVRYAESLYPTVKGIENLRMVVVDQFRLNYPPLSPSNPITQVPVSQINNPALQEALRQANTAEVVFSQPIDNGDKPQTIIGVKRVQSDPSAILLVEFETAPIFEESNLTAHENFVAPALRGIDGKVIRGDPSLFQSNNPAPLRVQLANLTVEIAGGASADQLNSNTVQLWGIRVIGIALALLSSALIYLIIDQEQQLKQAVYARTSELSLLNEQLEQDIADRTRAETALRQSEARNTSLISAIPDLMFRVDREGRYLSVHAPTDITSELALPAEKLLGRMLHEVLPISVANSVNQAVKLSASTGQMQVIEYELVPQTNTRMVFEARIVNTDPDESLVIVRNVTERRRAMQLLEERVTERTRELRSLLSVSQQIASTIELKPLLNIVLSQVQNLIGYDTAVILTPQSQEFLFQAYRGPESESDFLGKRVTAEWGLIAREIMLSHGALHLNDIQRNNEVFPRKFRAMLSPYWRDGLRDLHALLGLPIELKDHTIGVLILLNQQPDFYSEDKIELGMAIASQAAVAIDNAQLYEQAQAVAVVEERQRLARDLHDAVTQTLFSASLIAEVLPRIYERDRGDGERRLEELRKFTRGALAEMRMLLLELRPTGLTDALLGELLTQLGEAATARGHIPVFVTAPDEAALPPDVQITFYRIAQEALNNIVKHAQAKRVDIELYLQPNLSTVDSADKLEVDEEGRVIAQNATMTIRDNGRGFDKDNVPPTHMGLAIMRERAQSIGAQLFIKSEVGQGTQITFEWGQETAMALLTGNKPNVAAN